MSTTTLTGHGAAAALEAGARGMSRQAAAAWADYFQRLLARADRRPRLRELLQQDMLKALNRLIPSDASVLEVGAGAGDLLRALPNQVRHAVDVLPEALERIRALDPGIEVHLGDAATIQLGRRFDAIICDRLCHSVFDIQQMLRNLEQHLTPGGRIYLTAFNYLWALPLTLADRLGLHEPSPPQNLLTENHFANLFHLSGLESVAYEDRMLMPVPVPIAAPLINRYLTPLKPWNYLSLYRVYTLRSRHVVRPVPKVSVVVPARNEAGNIRAALERTPVMGAGTELIFVEGNSKDNTREVIEKEVAAYHGPLDVKWYVQTGKGKGDAVRLGFSKASGDLLMILDADLTVPPEELPKFVEVMARGEADYVHGTRLVYPMEDEAMRFLNKIGNAFFARTFTFLLNQPITDTLCGTKVVWREDYHRMARNRAYFGDFDPFGDFDLAFGARKLNLKMLEIPVHYKNRTYGETNISRFSHGLLLLRMSAFAARKLKFV